MKQFTPLLLGFLHMVGCSVGTPSNNDATFIEGVTARSACVGPLNRWHRKFAFQKRGNRINPNVIHVTYIQPGHRGLSAGRYLEEPEWGALLDDAQFRVAGGDFDQGTKRFVWWECGCNRGPFNVNRQTECKGNGR